MNNFSFYEAWGRVVSSTPIKKDVEMAEILGISPSNITRRKKENIFPIDWAFFIAREYDLTTEWILTGNGPKRFGSPPEFSVSEPTLKLADQWLSELAKDDSRRKDWFAVAFEEAFPMFREWKKRKEKEKSRGNIDPQSNVA